VARTDYFRIFTTLPVIAAAILVTSLLVLVTAVEPAQAAFPGTNGKFVFVGSPGSGSASEIYTADADGSNVTRLTNTFFNIYDLAPAWSPNGKQIVYETQPADNWEIYKMNADGSAQTNLTNSFAHEHAPSWSHDGSKIVFASDQACLRTSCQEIYTMDADGSNVTRLTNNQTTLNDPVWSPDGSKIAFVSGVEIWVMNADGTGQKKLTNAASAPSGSQLMDTKPTWSPTGSKIAFSRNTFTFFTSPGQVFTPPGQDVYTMDAVDTNNDGNGDNLKRLTTSNQPFNPDPAWSPDDTKIAFTGSGGITTMNAADGTGRTVLGLGGDPDWQPIVQLPPDSKPPDTSITDGPDDPANDATPTFTFGGFDDVTEGADLLFSYRVDNGEWSPYSSETSATLESLSDGSHTFYVRAKDEAGNEDTTPATQTFTVDTVAPIATIDSSEVNGDDATFGFSSTDGDVSRFECSLDGTDYRVCTSPTPYENLAEGAYTFYVRSIDQAGNEGVPDTQEFVIDTQTPETRITSGPDDPTNDVTPIFSFIGSDDRTASVDLRYSYRVDNGQWSEYSSETSAQLARLSERAHTFYVRAKDEADNEDATPAEQTFTIDTTAPRVTIDSGPSGTVNATVASFDFSSDETGSTFQCKIDGDEFAPCESSETYENLIDGNHTFEVKATDRAGNTGATASRAWEVDTEVPTVDVNPPNGATKISRTTDVTATFSKAMKKDTVTLALVRVNRNGTTTPISDTQVSYDEVTWTIKLNPYGSTTKKLAKNATYKATVEGTDLTGNPIAPTSWSFKTGRK
jgi:Tol biopolymer transport system component